MKPLGTERLVCDRGTERAECWRCARCPRGTRVARYHHRDRFWAGEVLSPCRTEAAALECSTEFGEVKRTPQADRASAGGFVQLGFYPARSGVFQAAALFRSGRDRNQFVIPRIRVVPGFTPMKKSRVSVPEDTRLDLIGRCNNRCCLCQTPFVVIHHIDEDPSNNDIGNLAPLCPNCHSQAHSTSQLTVNLTPSRIIALRDKWYDYCEQRRQTLHVGPTRSPNAILKVKNFVRSVGFAQNGWAKTFSAIDASYNDLTVNEIIHRVFATSNRDDLVTYLETVKYMYRAALDDRAALERFVGVCNAFGIGYDELD